jgi:hypothetical protein
MEKFSKPWEHYIIDNFLPDSIYKQLKELKIESNNSLCDGSRTTITGRYFFVPGKKDNLTKDVVKFFQDNKKNFETSYGYSLDHSYIRIELAQDNDSFWQVPHIDTFEKRITIIIYISSDVNDLGTDLFNDEKKLIKRVVWAPNRCFIFKTDENKWHGFTKRKFIGNRRVLLVNFVDKTNWKSKDQVWDS